MRDRALLSLGVDESLIFLTIVQLRPAQIVTAVGQIPEALTGNLEYGVADRGLDRSGAVVAHAEQRLPATRSTLCASGRPTAVN